MNLQVDLQGEPVGFPDHLTKRFPGDGPEAVAHDVTAEREFYCNKCDNRVTRSADRTCEYGHAKHCQHSVWEAGDR